jgi:hypothetical protein
MINSIRYFQEKGVKNLTKIFNGYADDPTKFAEMIRGVAKEVTRLASLLKNAGFVNITTNPEYDLITGWINKEYSVESISINGDANFSENESFRPDAEIVILFHRFKSDNE